jgi:hypothetical protein
VSEGMAIDVAMAEEIDQEALRPDQTANRTGDGPPQYSLYSQQPYVIYEIHLHPTYQVPTLWFTLHDLPNGESSLDIDSVYRYLVPEQYKSQLRGMGVTGGISATVSNPDMENLRHSDKIIAPPRHRRPSILHSPMPDQGSYRMPQLPDRGVLNDVGWVGWKLCWFIYPIRNGSGRCQRSMNASH